MKAQAVQSNGNEVIEACFETESIEAALSMHVALVAYMDAHEEDYIPELDLDEELARASPGLEDQLKDPEFIADNLTLLEEEEGYPVVSVLLEWWKKNKMNDANE